MKEYFEESRIVDYLFATHNGGKALDPIFSGAVFHNKNGGFCDVHLMKFKYTAAYRDMIEKDFVTGGVNTLGSPGQMAQILKYKQDTIESFYPTLIGNDQSDLDSPIKNLRTLRPSKIGTIRLPFAEVSHVCQINDDVRNGAPMFVLVTGHKKEGDDESCALI